MKRLIASAVVCLAVVVVATGDEITGIVTKFEDGKITFSDFKAGFGKGGGEAPAATTLPVAANAKFLKGKVSFDGGSLSFDVEGDYEGGKDAFAKAVKDAATKAADAKKADDKKSDDQKGKGFGKKGGGFGLFNGVFAQIITEGEGDKAKVTEIRVIDFKGFGKKGGR